MLIMFAALKAIPPELYEAARVDGASGRQIAWRIKIPLIAPAIILTFIFSIIGTLQLFNEPRVARSTIAPSVIGAQLHAEPVRLQPGVPEIASSTTRRRSPSAWPPSPRSSSALVLFVAYRRGSVADDGRPATALGGRSSAARRRRPSAGDCS